MGRSFTNAKTAHERSLALKAARLKNEQVVIDTVIDRAVKDATDGYSVPGATLYHVIVAGVSGEDREFKNGNDALRYARQMREKHKRDIGIATDTAAQPFVLPHKKPRGKRHDAGDDAETRRERIEQALDEHDEREEQQ